MPGFDKLSRKTVVTWNAMITGYALHGQGEDALSLFHQMIREDLKPDSITFTGILSACKIHCNVELGECAAKHLFELEPDNAGNYVLLSNIYAQADRWDDIRSLKEVMKEMGLKKRSGWSWICVRNRVHVFSMEDGSHPQMAEIYANLHDLVGQMEAAGYVPVTNGVLENVEEEENENILSIHSEKLAIAFGSRAHLEKRALATRKWYRNILMKVFHLCVIIVAGSRVKDTQCGFKMFTRAAVRAFPLMR